MKKCKDCKVQKQLSEFYGVQGECKECTKKAVRKNYKQNREYYRKYDKHRQRYSIKRIINHKYSMMKMSVEGRNHHGRSCVGKELCTKEEFLAWFKKTEVQFIKLYKVWKKSGFDRKLSPSVDRIDNSRGYSIDNIQWLTQSDNSKKYNK